jgi:hypothetical protein
VVKFRYVATTLKNEICYSRKIKPGLNSGKVCSQSVHNVFSPSLLYENIKIKILTTLILPLVLYKCEIWSFILKEEYGQSVVFGGNGG